MADRPLTLPERLVGHLQRVYGVGESEVLNLYLLGSRLWGTHHEGSDYDVTAVLAESARISTSRHTHSGSFDVQLVPLAAFRELLSANDAHAVLCAALPWTHVLQERQPLEPRLNPVRFVASVEELVQKVCSRARHDVVEKGHVQRAQKAMLHGLRMLDLARQLLSASDTDEIDWRCGQKFQHVVYSTRGRAWRAWEESPGMGLMAGMRRELLELSHRSSERQLQHAGPRPGEGA